MTSAQTERAKAKLATLVSSFDELEALVEPLFSQTLPETVIGLEPIQQAKLQTLLPYLVYDLIFIYLKSRGIDPKTHPVIAELDRVKQYFNKINNAENTPQRRTEINKDVAQRFIKHAIASVASKVTPTEEAPAQTSTFVQPKVTTKMLERQQYEKELKEQDAQSDNEDSDLEMYGEGQDSSPQVGKNVKGKGKCKTVEEPVGPVDSQAPTKRRRPAIDPFAGYGDQPPNSVTAQPGMESNAEVKTQPKKKRRVAAAGDSAAMTPIPSQPTSGSHSPAPGSSEAKSSKKGKKKKKAH